MRDFYIDNIHDDTINVLSIALNDLEEVTQLQIINNTIQFVCYDVTNIESILHEIDEHLVLHEVIDEQKQVFEEEVSKKEMIFLFKNLYSEEDALLIKDILSKYRSYDDVSVDFKNKLLTLTTADQHVEKRLNRIIDKVNMEIDVSLWQKPFRSEDLFKQTYLQRYIRYTILLVAMALAIVTSKDKNIFTAISYLIVTGLACDDNVVACWKDLRSKRLLSRNVTFILGLLIGWIYGAYFETFIVAVIFRSSEAILMRVTALFVNRIDKEVRVPEMGRKKISYTEFVMIPLSEFEVGDILVVYPGEKVLLGGKVVKGNSVVDTYALDGKEVVTDQKLRGEILSGTINLEGELQIKVTHTYENSAFCKLMNIVSLAPSYETRIQRITDKLIKYSTSIFIFIALVCSVVLPFIDYKQYSYVLYISATLLTLASGHAIRESTTFGILAGVAKAFKEGILIRENSSLDSINVCQTIIYDRFDGVEISDDELMLFEKLGMMHHDLIIFNDGPVNLENDQYQIHNNFTLEEKIMVMQKANLYGPVAYIGDCSKDILLMQKAFVSISRGGIHDDELIDNSDIIITDVNHSTIYSLFALAKKQSYIAMQNMLFTIISMLLLVMLSVSSVMSWHMIQLCYFLTTYCIIANTYRIFRSKRDVF